MRFILGWLVSLVFAFVLLYFIINFRYKGG